MPNGIARQSPFGGFHFIVRRPDQQIFETLSSKPVDSSRPLLHSGAAIGQDARLLLDGAQAVDQVAQKTVVDALCVRRRLPAIR